MACASYYIQMITSLTDYRGGSNRRTCATRCVQRLIAISFFPQSISFVVIHAPHFTAQITNKYGFRHLVAVTVVYGWFTHAILIQRHFPVVSIQLPVTCIVCTQNIQVAIAGATVYATTEDNDRITIFIFANRGFANSETQVMVISIGELPHYIVNAGVAQISYIQSIHRSTPTACCTHYDRFCSIAEANFICNRSAVI